MTGPAPDVQVVELDPPGVQVVEIGVDAAATPVYVPGTGGGGAGATVLDQLEDVAAAAAAPAGALLIKSPDGLWRGRSPVEHVQSIPATVWGPIVHNLGRRPVAWSLFDDQGRECGQYVVQHLDDNTCRVAMDLPTAGVIRLL